MWASVRPCAIMATDVTRLAVSRNGAATPAMSKISSVRGKMASAFECTDCDARFDEPPSQATARAFIRQEEANGPGTNDQNIRIDCRIAHPESSSTNGPGIVMRTALWGSSPLTVVRGSCHTTGASPTPLGTFPTLLEGQAWTPQQHSAPRWRIPPEAQPARGILASMRAQTSSCVVSILLAPCHTYSFLCIIPITR